MAWIESHQSLGEHPKMADLATRLNVSWPTTIGHLQYLWWWALDAAPGGTLPETVTPKLLAKVMHWPGNPAKLFDGLLGAKWIDKGVNGSLQLHDWDDYAGNLVAKRASNAERQRRHRDAIRNSDKSVTSRVTSPLRNGATQPTQPTQPGEPALLTPQPPPKAPAAETDTDKIFRLVNDNIQPMNTIIRGKIEGELKYNAPGIVLAAVEKAIVGHARSWGYVEKILRGNGQPPKPKAPPDARELLKQEQLNARA